MLQLAVVEIEIRDRDKTGVASLVKPVSKNRLIISNKLVNINMELGVVGNVCSFVVFLYILAVAFNKLFKESPHENLMMKFGLVYILTKFPCS